MANQFGRRFITHKEFLDYARDLDLFTDQPSPHFLEYLERRGILNPVARVRFPQEIVRRWHKERYPSSDVPTPIEGDTSQLAAASELRNQIDSWSDAAFYGEQTHPLDAMVSAHTPFIQIAFDPSTFLPWDNFRTPVQESNGNQIHDRGQYARTCYHYWQVFPLAAFLRSGVTILYDLGDAAIFEELRRLQITDSSRDALYTTMNIEARHELTDIMSRASLFDAVAYFEAFRRNALEAQWRGIDRSTGKLPWKLQRTYEKRRRELARETMTRFGLKPDDVLSFIKFQCELWCTARRRSPAKLADEYARNITATITLYQQATRATEDQVTERVGSAGGYFKPILRVIFPRWLDEQRDLAERSLESWMLPSMTRLPAPFKITKQDIADFCDWLEQEKLYQLYWHFRRLVDIGLSDSSIARTAIAGEVVSFTNTVELMVNAIVESRGRSARSHTLMPKMRDFIINPNVPQLTQLLIDFKHLTNTNNSTLKRRLAQIDQIKRGVNLAPVLRVLLKLVVIRNEGSHLGLTNFNRSEIYTLLESLIQASLLIWKIR
jgi:hypothetical protein